ncbi:hypothetical protein GM661_00370 [Iocasia frigidifontis]|uniref:Uncharacterized protein n=1 Tax=Iocasia fonsfrigidae TaxID=2682810 RepID=A0A8A7KAH5_9FIRM|nr:hypothetical protein [Iocasia fonsfrigidae]QTL96528.1 hypothetical protein GM661_00370 [Iocasia fonsfrigidae]
MKYPKYVYKRINGEESYFGLCRKTIADMMDRNKKDSTDGTAESTRKIS